MRIMIYYLITLSLIVLVTASRVAYSNALVHSDSVAISQAINNAIQFIHSLPSGSQCFPKKKLQSGLSNVPVFKITCGSGTYVIRILTTPLVDKKRELQAQKAASERGYGPHLYGYDIEQGWIVMEFIHSTENVVSAFYSLSRKDASARMAKLLVEMHKGPELSGRRHDLLKAIKKVSSRLMLPKQISQEKVQALIKQLEMVKPLNLTPIHGDLTPTNILFNGEFKAIDFSEAMQGDPYVDISTVMLFFQMDDDWSKQLFTDYLGRFPSKKEMEHLTFVNRLISLYYGYASLYKVSMKTFDQNIPIVSLKEMLDSFKKGELDLKDSTVQFYFAVNFLNQAIKSL